VRTLNLGCGNAHSPPINTATNSQVQDSEIDRILKAFRLDSYAVLDLQPGVPESDIKKTYRTKSLLIHPDKTSNPRAPDAFDRLKKAQNELMDEAARERLDESIADARMLLMREKEWTADTHGEELQSDEFKSEWREKTKWVLMDNEKRRQRQLKAQMQEEGRQQRKDDEELEERKRKRDHQEKWEATREERIGSWRDFQKGKGAATNGAAIGGEQPKKKKKKMKPIG
jgi:DnaJ family protein C protein 8